MKRLALAALALCGCLDFDGALERCRRGETCAVDSGTAGGTGGSGGGGGGGGGNSAGGDARPHADGGLCFGRMCWENPLPQGNQLLALGGTAPDDVWAAGWANMLMHWDGTAWTSYQEEVAPEPIAAKVTLEALWIDDAGVRAVSGYQEGPFVRAGGGAWQKSPYTSLQLLSLAGTSPDTLWATSTSSELKHRTASSWAAIDLGGVLGVQQTGGPIDVTRDGAIVSAAYGNRLVRCASSACDAGIVFNAPGQIVSLSRARGPLTVQLHNGQTWEELPDAGFERVAMGTSFTATSASFLSDGGGLLAAVDDRIYALDRGSWVDLPVDRDPGGDDDFRAVLTAPALTGSWAAGEFGKLSQLGADGQWKRRSSGVPGTIIVGTVLGGGEPLLANSGRELLRRDANGSWYAAATSPSLVTALGPADAGAAWVGRLDGIVEHWDRVTFTPHWDAGQPVTGIVELPSGLWVATTGAVHRLNGTPPTAVRELTADAGLLRSLSGWDERNLFVVDGTGRVGERSEDGGWRLTPLASTLYTVFAHPDAGVWATGYQSVFRRLAPGSWVAVTVSASSAELTGVVGTSATNVWISGEWGVVARFNGSVFERVESGTRNDLDVLIARDGELWFAGEFGSVLHYAP